ncbi:MAG: 1-acyl-sn-glycerol-3-phosphate acyltransferase [Bacteroidales bacterium]
MKVDKFKDIRPYKDEEEAPALQRIASHPLLNDVASYLFPGKDPDEFSSFISSLTSVNDFQDKVMLYAIKKIVQDTSKGLSYSGIENISQDKKYLFISNHRDILLDSALIQVILKTNGIETSEMAVGDNLVTDPFMEDIARSNKMIKVIRSSNPRELYKSSLLLSEYIRDSISTDRSSVWIAQRNGRTKDGIDTTEQGLLKMLDMSGKGDFINDFNELSIMPVSISYEYEPCDFLKAKELYITRRTKYKKAPGEDLNSILTGIMQFKGQIHINFNKPISLVEIEECSYKEKNERFKSLAEIIDRKIAGSYKLWNSNRISHDILKNKSKYSSFYTPEEKASFENYYEFKTSDFEGDKQELKEIFLSIYANATLNCQ